MMLPLNEAQCMMYRRSSKNWAPLIFRHPIASFRQGSSIYMLYTECMHAHVADVEISL